MKSPKTRQKDTKLDIKLDSVYLTSLGPVAKLIVTAWGTVSEYELGIKDTLTLTVPVEVQINISQ